MAFVASSNLKKETMVMKNKLKMLFIVLVLAISLAACSGAQQNPAVQSTAQNSAQTQPTLPQAQATPQQPGGNPPAGDGAPPTQSKLAVGTLKLEGTSLAVTAAQAKTLLPLWQQVQTLMANANTTSDQLQAVYTQIQAFMTADQNKTIESTNLSPADLQALMNQLGIQNTQPNGGGGQPLGTPPAVKGTPPAGAGQPGQPGQADQQGTPDPNGIPGRGGGPGRGMDSRFIDPLIKLLQTRAGA
jgi:hypothetical protein